MECDEDKYNPSCILHYIRKTQLLLYCTTYWSSWLTLGPRQVAKISVHRWTGAVSGHIQTAPRHFQGRFTFFFFFWLLGHYSAHGKVNQCSFWSNPFFSEWGERIPFISLPDMYFWTALDYSSQGLENIKVHSEDFRITLAIYTLNKNLFHCRLFDVKRFD